MRTTQARRLMQMGEAVTSNEGATSRFGASFSSEATFARIAEDNMMTRRAIPKILLLAHDSAFLHSVREVLRGADLRMTLHPVATHEEFLLQLRMGEADMILAHKDGLPEFSTRDILEHVHQVDPNLPVFSDQTMDKMVSDSLRIQRLSVVLVGLFSLLALVLAAIGIYGVLAYSVVQRTREIGVRMALGAQRSTVHQLILKEAGRLIAWGIAIGTLCSLAAATLLHSLLFGVRSWDVATLAAVAFVLATAAFLASYIPAHRAASINPVDALRAE